MNKKDLNLYLKRIRTCLLKIVHIEQVIFLKSSNEIKDTLIFELKLLSTLALDYGKKNKGGNNK